MYLLKRLIALLFLSALFVGCRPWTEEERDMYDVYGKEANEKLDHIIEMLEEDRENNNE